MRAFVCVVDAGGPGNRSGGFRAGFTPTRQHVYGSLRGAGIPCDSPRTLVPQELGQHAGLQQVNLSVSGTWNLTSSHGQSFKILTAKTVRF
jgi:hypothetical protein